MAVLVALLLAPLAWHYTPDVILVIGTEHTSRRWCEIHSWAHREVMDRSCSKPGTTAWANGTLRRIDTAEALFREGDKDGNGVLDYAGSLAALEKAGLIDARAIRRLGYAFNVSATASTFSVSAVPGCPVCRGGDPTFFLDQTGVVRMSTTGVAGPESPALGR
jgi:hypothetical protein